MASYRTQPHRKSNARRSTAALSAMQRGKPAFFGHPMDAKRGAAKKRKKRLVNVLRGR